MTDEVMVRVEGVSKKFARSLRRSMYYGLWDMGRDALGLVPRSDRLRDGEFWAVDDLSFEIGRGECLGLIGANGSGKSTLLKMMSGIIIPDQGRIETRGRIGSLIELGAGFHSALTGRENIYINGAILGLKKREIDECFDSIVEFAELEEFLDSPVKFYSSGMFVRLGFAVAAHLKPDVLLIDEVLAVGDVGFRAKCYNLISEIMKTSAVILVSHNLPLIARYSTRILVLDNGRGFEGPSKAENIEYYYRRIKGEARRRTTEAPGNRLREIRILGEPRTGQVLRIRLQAELEEPRPLVRLVFLNQENAIVAFVRTEARELAAERGKLDVEIAIDPLILAPGLYQLNLIVFDHFHKRHLVWSEAALSFQVKGEPSDFGPTAVIMSAQCRPPGEDVQ